MLALLVINGLRGVFRVAAVKAPGFGDRRVEMLAEIAVVTGGSVISGEAGLMLEKTTIENLGTAGQIRVHRGSTKIVDGGGDSKSIGARSADIRLRIAEASSDHDREKLEERLAKLTGSVALIRMCADIRATRTDNEGQAAGVRLLLRAAEEPFRQFVANGGGDPGVALNTVRNGAGNFGYNAATMEFGDLVKTGVIDPTKVTRLALQNAVSLAGLLLTIAVAVTSG